MSKRTISIILAVHLAICWVAVAFRIDRFPLTWAPMYSVYKPKKDVFTVSHKDKKFLGEFGWLATRLDGETEWVTRYDVNVPNRSMWRLYYQRTFGKGPPKYKHMNHDAGTFDRWLWGLEAGEPFIDIDWKHRMLVAVNKTLGREPGAPDFIVSLEATGQKYRFDRDTLAYIGVDERHVVVTWDESWRSDFQ